MGFEDDLPPSSPPPPINSPLHTPLDRLPGFDFASATPSLLANGFHFEAAYGSFDFAASTTIPEVTLDRFHPSSFGALDSPSFGRELDLGLPATPSTAPATPVTDPRYIPINCNKCGKAVRCYKNSTAPLDVHRDSKPCKIEVRRLGRQLEVAAANLARADITPSLPPRPRSLSLQPTLPALPLQLPARRTASDPTVLRGRELARSPRRARSNSRSISPVQGHRSSSVPADMTYQTAPSTNDEDNAECPGVLLDWAALTDYPWGVHLASARMNLPYRPERFTGEGNDTRLWVRSVRCTRLPGVAQPECAPCRSVRVGQAVNTLKTRAQAAPSHTPYQYLTHNQLVNALRESTAEKDEQRLKVLSMTRKVSRSTARMSDQKRLLMAISTCDVPRLSTLMRVAMKQRVGPKEMIRRLSDAVNTLHGGYRTKSFSDTEKKLMRCMKQLAGRKGVYALSKALGLPSSSTIRASNPLRFVPSVAAPTAAEFGTNIRTFFGEASINSTFRKTGHSLMADGLHLSHRANWDRGSDQIIGLCREHSGTLDLAMNDMASVLKVVEAVHGDSPTVHYGREATVFAIGAFRDDNYHAVAVGQTQTCKSEKGPAFAAMLRTAIEQWDIHGAPHNGPLIIVSTDGDSVFREGTFEVLMCSTVDESSSLYLKLSSCKGLNLQCGKNGAVSAPDPKHVVKRIATSERSPEGTVIDQVIINRPIITQWLERLPGETKETVAILVDPADHQNVPRAHRLLKAVISLGAEGIPDSPSLSPTDHATRRAFTLAGEMWGAFLDAFTHPAMSLSEHLQSLSKFAHMAFVFYRLHGSSFLSNQLYGDLQALVKSAFFCVARQQEIAPDDTFRLYQIGSDRLEELFAEVRTESHDSNVDAKQLSERLSSAADTLAIFNENPEWDQGHVRRSWSGKEADHVNPTYFTGDAYVRNVVPATVWRSGGHLAREFLLRHGIDFDFEEAFSHLGVDMLCPNGGGVYPGIAKDKDRSVPDPSSSPPSGVPADTTPPSMSADSDDEEQDDTILEPDVDSEQPVDLPNITLEDILPEPEEDCEPDSNTSTSTSIASPRNNDWLDYELDNGTTKRLHKASILSTLFNSDYRRLAVGRLLRVRCYTKDGGRKPNLNHQEFSGEHSFNIGDIGVALIRTQNIIAAAVVKVTVIGVDKQRLSQVDTEELGFLESRVMITAQPLILRDVVVVGDGDTIPSTRKWLWTGNYAKFDALKGPQSSVEAGTRKALTIKVPGAFLHPLDAEIEEVRHLSYSDREPLLAKHMPHVWAVSNDDLTAVVSTLYSTLDSATVLRLLPKHGKSSSFPYRSSKDAAAFIVDSPTQLLTEKGKNSEKILCHQCEIYIKPDDARGHVGGHILKSIKGIPESNLVEKVDKNNPCGFCGRGECRTDLSGNTTSRASPKCTSTCLRAHSYSYGHAKKYSANTPCTNVPIFCTLCVPVPPRKSPAVFWKYSMHSHIQSAHPRYWDNVSDAPIDLPTELAINVAVSREEMIALGVRIGSSTAPLASTLVPASSRGSKRALEDITNDAGPSNRQRT